MQKKNVCWGLGTGPVREAKHFLCKPHELKLKPH